MHYTDPRYTKDLDIWTRFQGAPSRVFSQETLQRPI
jgi:hypothetical protein